MNINQVKQNIGYVIKTDNYLITVKGFDSVNFYEQVEIENKAKGYVIERIEGEVIIALTHIYQDVLVGDKIYALNKVFKALFSSDSFGRVVNIFAIDYINNCPLENYQEINIENKTTPIRQRMNPERPLLTGINEMDINYPIFKGQRHLILGNTKSKNLQFCLDVIRNQKDTICLYVSLGKTKDKVEEIYHELENSQVLSNCVIFSTLNTDLPTLTVLTPYVALSVAEKYMYEGKDVLVILDDLDYCAKQYQMIKQKIGQSLHLNKLTFSDLMISFFEKACQYDNGGSITVFSVSELAEDIIEDKSIYKRIDGHIVLSE